ncbi:MAG: NAD(P)-binding domain-containing protein, partial [Candidatus Eiseniibacteriota bacterium]
MLTTVIFVSVTVVLTIWYMVVHLKKERANSQLLSENVQAGVNEPPSLHPVIDFAACIGCGGCVEACPEFPLHSPLGLVQGKAVLIDAAHCIGHGACKLACPTNAIELVFGTEKRGVDIPIVKPNFETDSPNIFIAGELGGMGLIANAIDQGRSALESIKKVSGIGQGERLDVVIVGAGPSGFSASLAAMQNKLRYRTIEQGDLGGTVYNFPRGKIVMTRAVNLPMIGKVKITETTKEKLLEFWQKVEKDTSVKINYRERLENITRTPDGLLVKTTVGEYKALTVLLCLGRGGTPRKLGVPGDEHPKVIYRLIDPAEFAGKKVLVVGGGDSALEAAHALADEKGATVTLSYREKAFTRAKEKNRKKVEQAEKEGRLTILYESKVKEVHEASVDFDHAGKSVSVPNEAIICCLGGILPTPFLKQIGIEVETKHGETSKDPKPAAKAEPKAERAPREERAPKEDRTPKSEAAPAPTNAPAAREERPAEVASAPAPAPAPAASAEQPVAKAEPRPAAAEKLAAPVAKAEPRPVAAKAAAPVARA